MSATAATRLYGLGQSYWAEVIDVLRSIIPVYDRVNRAISLGQDMKFRAEGIKGRIFPGDTILDAGCGFGNMSLIALRHTQGTTRVVMYDPIPQMLASAKKYLGCPPEGLSSGIFEFMPFRDCTFDAVLCGYSLRDAIQLRDAILEMHRILKRGGRLIVVDLGKPDGSVSRFFVSLYLKYILGVMAFIAAGRAGLRFKTLYGTFLKWPRNSELRSMLEEKFERVEFRKAMMGGAIIVAAYK